VIVAFSELLECPTLSFVACFSHLSWTFGSLSDPCEPRSRGGGNAIAFAFPVRSALIFLPDSGFQLYAPSSQPPSSRHCSVHELSPSHLGSPFFGLRFHAPSMVLTLVLPNTGLLFYFSPAMARSRVVPPRPSSNRSECRAPSPMKSLGRRAFPPFTALDVLSQIGAHRTAVKV